jgi:hypothetical protein
LAWRRRAIFSKSGQALSWSNCLRPVRTTPRSRFGHQGRIRLPLRMFPVPPRDLDRVRKSTQRALSSFRRRSIDLRSTRMCALYGQTLAEVGAHLLWRPVSWRRGDFSLLPQARPLGNETEAHPGYLPGCPILYPPRAASDFSPRAQEHCCLWYTCGIRPDYGWIPVSTEDVTQGRSLILACEWADASPHQ